MSVKDVIPFIFNKPLKKSKKALIPGPTGSTEDINL